MKNPGKFICCYDYYCMEYGICVHDATLHRTTFQTTTYSQWSLRSVTCIKLKKMKMLRLESCWAFLLIIVSLLQLDVHDDKVKYFITCFKGIDMLLFLSRMLQISRTRTHDSDNSLDTPQAGRPIKVRWLWSRHMEKKRICSVLHFTLHSYTTWFKQTSWSNSRH